MPQGGPNKKSYGGHSPGQRATFHAIVSVASQLTDYGSGALYRVKGLVSHVGSINFGHYISYVRSHADDQAWFKINDDDVEDANFADSVNDPEYWNGRRWTPWILAYVKLRDDEEDVVESAQSRQSSWAERISSGTDSTQKSTSSDEEMPDANMLLRYGKRKHSRSDEDQERKKRNLASSREEEKRQKRAKHAKQEFQKREGKRNRSKTLEDAIRRKRKEIARTV